MQADDLRAVMERELRTLAREVAAYPDDAALWRDVPGLANPGGVLARHLAGNVRAFIGTVLGGGGFVRDRDGEFAARGLTRAEVVAEVEAARAEVARVLPTLDAARLAAEYPQAVGGHRFTTARFVTHLAVHLGYHLGQLDYHRRMVAPASGTVGTLPLGELQGGP
ncbi:MAG: DinB family protein [Gemmatimonadaceae bacterium]|nr:DinB family protein [Gemmatimonadaceae bacterium]